MGKRQGGRSAPTRSRAPFQRCRDHRQTCRGAAARVWLAGAQADSGLPTTHWPRAGSDFVGAAAGRTGWHRAGALCLVGGAPGPRAERGPDVAGDPSAGLDA
ncbi:hypothetical protein [Dictyobacter arantiisoli]|uniref:hypothetical protein n=1 Tax=Dictyobacter arantiisoli TaxID=2014874 RepID=UPI0011EC5C26|nr:hypothetical protein [Dictyobacter arantiisoli]